MKNKYAIGFAAAALLACAALPALADDAPAAPTCKDGTTSTVVGKGARGHARARGCPCHEVCGDRRRPRCARGGDNSRRCDRQVQGRHHVQVQDAQRCLFEARRRRRVGHLVG